MNLTGRQPFTKTPREAPDPDHLRRVRELPCCICEAYGEPQMSPTQAHHCIEERNENRKVPDRQSIPLCEGHHQGLFDTSKISRHLHPDAWRAAYGSDRYYIAATLDKLGL